MLTPEVSAKLDELGKSSCLLVGIEAHVCVQQTCLDLLQQGKQVHLIVDGVSGQQAIDRQVALQRLQAAGAFLTTAQSAAFVLMQTAEHPNFKTVSSFASGRNWHWSQGNGQIQRKSQQTRSALTHFRL